MRKFFPVLLLVIRCKTPDGVYRQTPPPEKGNAAEFQVVGYGGYTFAISHTPGRLLQVQNIGELSVYKSTGHDGKQKNSEDGAFPRTKKESVTVTSSLLNRKVDH